MPAKIWTPEPMPATRTARIAVRAAGGQEPVIGRRWDGQPEKFPLELAASLNVWAYRCRRALMAAFNSAPPICRDKRTNEIIDTKGKSKLVQAAREYLALLAAPNAEMSGNDLFDSIVDWLNVRQAFIWMVPPGERPEAQAEDKKQRPAILKMLPADRVYPKHNNNGILVGWELRRGDAGRAATTLIPAWQIIRLGFHNTQDPLRGLPPLSVAFTAADLGYAIQLHHIGFFDRGAKLSGLIAPKGAAEGQAISVELQARLQAAADSIGGVGNAHQVLVLPGEATFTSYEQAIKDADFQALDSIVRDQLAAAHGVPRFMLGVPGDNRGDEKEALRTFQTGTVGPMRDDVRDKLNRHLSWRFHPDLLLDFDVSQVPALAEERSEWAAAFLHTMSGLRAAAGNKAIISVAEAREVVNEKFGLELNVDAVPQEEPKPAEPPQEKPPAGEEMPGTEEPKEEE